MVARRVIGRNGFVMYAADSRKEKMKMRKYLKILAVSAFAVLAGLMFYGRLAMPQQIFPGNASPLHRVVGAAYASGYGTWQGKIIAGNAATGSGQTITFLPGPLQDGTFLSPAVWTTANTPIFVNDGSPEVVSTITAETIGPCPAGNLGIGQGMGPCVTLTGTFANVHGQQAIVQSGTAGLQEAVNDLQQQYVSSGLGGVVNIDGAWSFAAASLPSQTPTSVIALVTPFPNVFVQDLRGPVPGWLSAQPSTLSNLATPATRSAAAGNTQVIASGTGTFTNAAQFVCVTYVDILGNESTCSGSFSVTPSGTQGLLFAAPAASTGAVGWKPYTGITGVTTQYEYPLTSSICTLTTAETVIPACAMTSTALLTTPQTATKLAPQAFTTNLYLPLTQSHTTFAYQPTGKPVSFETAYGPFTATGSITAGQVGVLGTIPLPSAILNTIGRTIRFTGNITTTPVSTAAPTISVDLGPTFSTGTPTVVCNDLMPATTGSAAYNFTFSCTLTTNATGSSGTVMANSFAIGAIASSGASPINSAGTTTAATTDNLAPTAAQGGASYAYVILTATTAAFNPAQLVQFVVELL